MNSEDNQAYHNFVAKQASKFIMAQKCSQNSITTQGKVAGQIRIIYKRWSPVVTRSGFYLLSPELDSKVLSEKWVSALKKLVVLGITRNEAIERLAQIVEARVANDDMPRSFSIDSWYQVLFRDIDVLREQWTEESRSEFLCLWVTRQCLHCLTVHQNCRTFGSSHRGLGYDGRCPCHW